MKYLLLLLPCLFIYSDNYTIKPTNLSDYGTLILSPKRFNNGIVYSMQTNNGGDHYGLAEKLYFSEIIEKETLGEPNQLIIKLPFSLLKAIFPFKTICCFDYCAATGEVFFTAQNPDKGSENGVFYLAIYSGTINDLTIKNVHLLSFCDTDNNYSHSTISSDGKTLIFAYGEVDGNVTLYQSTRNNINDAWSAPSSIQELKSDGKNFFPKLLNDSLLVYASNMPSGNGGLDLYFTQKKDGHWSSPTNWEAINTAEDEASVEMIDETSGYITADWDESPMPKPDQLYYFQMDKAPWEE